MYSRVHAVGDSHTLHMGGLFRIHHFCDSEGQGATAHNLISEKSATDSNRKLRDLLDSLDPAKDIILMSFGEVDCRLHIRSTKMLTATMERYTQAIHEVRARGFRTIVHAVIGAVPQDNLWRDPDYPDAETRGAIVVDFNSRLSAWCEDNDVEFLDLGFAENGVLPAHMTDDGVHLNDRAIPMYRRWAFSANLGEQVKNCVWSLGAMSFHAKTVADALGWPLFVECPLGDDIETAYIIGMYDVPDYDFTLECTKRAKRRIIQWCGSDVQALSRPEMLPDAIHLCETRGIQKEMRDKGIEASICMFPTQVHAPVTPLPEEHTVSFYAGTDPHKYGARTLAYLMECLPDVRFHVYNFGDYDAPTMASLIDATRVYVRFTRHDGAAASAREFMEAGRRVVATLDMPFVKEASLADPTAIVRAVRAALNKDEPDTKAAAYYAAENSRDRFIRDFQGVVDSHV